VSARDASSRASRSPLRWVLGGGGVVLILLALRLSPLGTWLRGAVDLFAALGAWGIVLFVLVYALAAVLFVPGSALTLAAGGLFGLLRGTIAVSVAATLGAGGGFLVARYLARARVERWAAANPRFAAIDDAVGREGWKIVLLTRLSPVFPYNLLNYLYGLTRIRFGPYLLASWIGMIPGTILYVYLGFVGTAIAGAASGGAGRTPAEYTFWGVGLLATVTVTLYVTRLARRALQRQAEGSARPA
jgi:uncharacterized membrane protein YdjX (TVP38/TMEM64 family)